MKKGSLIRILLAASLVLSALLPACAEKTPAEETGATTAVPQAVTEEPAETADPSTLPDQGLFSLDFGGEKIRIATTEPREYEFKAEEQTGSVVNDAVLTRNQAVMSDLGIAAFETVPYPESGGNSKELKNAVIAANKAGGDDAIDFITAPSYYTTSYITDGLILNLEAIEGSRIDTGKTYWSGKYYENGMFNGKAFFLIGDLTPTLIEKLEVVFLNDTLAETYLAGEPKTLYQTVYDGEWTFDRFLELVAKCGDAASSKIYGCDLPNNSYTIDGFEAGMCIDLVRKLDDTIESGGTGEQNVEIIETLRKFYYENPAVNCQQNQNYPYFKSGTALFGAGLLQYSKDFIAADIDYSIYPMPMRNADQADYVAISQDTHSIICIPKCAADRAEMITAVLEDLAYRSHDTVYMAMYELTYSARYSDNAAESEMFDFINRHVAFSFGSIYSYILGEVKNTPRYLVYPSTASSSVTVSSPIASSLKTLDKLLTAKFKTFLTALEDY